MSDETLNFQFVLPQVEKAPVGEQGEMAEYIPYKIKAGVTMESILAELRAQPHMASLLPYLNPGRRLYLLKSSGLELLKLAAQYIGTYHFLDHPDDEAYVTTSEPEQSGADGGKDEDDAWRSGGTQAREFNFGENMPYLKALELQQFYGSDDTPFGFGQQLYLPDQWARHRPWWTLSDRAPVTITIGGEDHFDRFREANILQSIPEIVRNMSARTLIILLCCCKPSSSTENLSLNFGIDLDGPEDWSGTHTFTMDDLSFELETDVICLEPPKEDSPYKQAVLCQLAREKGAPLEQPADAKKLLHLIRDRRGDADNLTLSKVVSNALIRRKGTGPLTMKDFGYLSALFVSRKKPRRKSREKEMELVGQQAVRRQLEQIVDSMAFQARRRRLGLPADAIHYTFAFLGAPGTGKTTWARWLAKRMAEQKLLSDTSSICINAAELKAKYVGHTTAKVHALFEEYGVIILDEAYSLIEGDGGDCFGAEALSQLCVELENHGSDRLVIFAGYGGSGNPEDNRMLRFLQSNPGINSRISFKIHFQDFRPGELVQVLHTMLTFDGYRLPEGTDPLAEDFFRRGLRRRAFGNCREVRNLADRIKIYTAARLAQVKPCTREMASQILLPDVEAAIQEITEEYDGLDRNQGRPVGFS